MAKKNKTGRMPDFLIIGASRAGTTSLHAYLRQCPGVFMPEAKEPNFFAFEGEALSVQGPGADYINNSTTDLATYQKLFQPAPSGALLGEASPIYLYSPKAPERIRAHVPHARLVAVLRNPVEQAFSHYLFARKQAIETEADFVRALALEEERMAAGWQPLFAYSQFPRYGEQLERYFATFPREQILVRDYAEFRDDPAGFTRDVLDFIGEKSDFRPDVSHRLNAGGVPKNKLFQDFLMKPNPITGAIGLVVPRKTRWMIRDWLAKLNLKRPDEMPPEARKILVERLADDVARLEKLLNRDFSHWLR